MGALAFDEMEGAISAYLAVLRSDISEPSFDDVNIEISTFGQINEHAVGKLYADVRKTCRRLYASVKYGSPSQVHRLTKPDKVACDPDIDRTRPNTVRFNLSHVFRNAWRIAQSWAAPAEQLEFSHGLLDLIKERTTPLKEQRTHQLFSQIVTYTALVGLGVGLTSVVLDHRLEMHKEDNRQQLALRHTVSVEAKSGSTTLAKADREKIADDTRHRIARVADTLAELGKDPVYRFVETQIVQYRPALFSVLAESGGGTVNGVELTAGGARAAQKQIKRITPAAGPWSTTVTISS